MTPGKNNAVMELERGSVTLGRAAVLRAIDFRLGPGELVVLLGDNGSGKTTLVRSLLGLVPLSGGRARLYGQELSDFKHWNTIGYVPQRVTAASGVPATVGEVVLSGRAAKARPWRRYDDADRSAAGRALELVDLSEAATEPVASLSGGQQQRVLIARALASEPGVLVLDEPVASVDLAHQEDFAATLDILKARGTTILMVAHSLGAMERLVQRAVVLEGGRVVHDGPARGHVLEHGHHPHALGHGS